MFIKGTKLEAIMMTERISTNSHVLKDREMEKICIYINISPYDTTL